jgi:DNA-directed RNA polymerase specialized sigma24 family protein
MRKNNPYILPDDVRQQAIGALRGYHRLQQQLAELSDTAAPDSDTGVRRMLIHSRLVAMDRAIAQIPEEYRAGLLGKLWHHAPYPYIAGEATWKRQRRKLLYYTAKYLAIP